MSSYAFTDHDAGPPLQDDGLTVSVHDGSHGCTDPWVCEHRWPQIAEMVKFRNLCHQAPVTAWWSDGADRIAFARMGCGFVAINRDPGGPLAQTLPTTLEAGTYCDVLIGGLDDAGEACVGTEVTVGADGMASFDVPVMSALALRPDARL